MSLNEMNQVCTRPRSAVAALAMVVAVNAACTRERPLENGPDSGGGAGMAGRPVEMPPAAGQAARERARALVGDESW
ncbi:MULTISPECIES: hypothetical protein [Sorangium]|uniref:Uncharacterized protein n=1 Tax=Sorangium cellulosum TaxID=56 RepID=A0A4P2QE53_SORCE|nr:MULTISPECIES: hypothetical protein [Sorangium]AUX28090.1 uncharacterized protein SOCE836_001580 [Sorangium cellulosum]WCQ87494.1 hypothetical protein NQZ70_00157 [Sorangium sp. Soce836]